MPVANALDLFSPEQLNSGDLPAAAFDATKAAVADWWRRKQDESYAAGYGDPATGLPTGKAVTEGLQSWANALMPGGPEGGFGGIIAGERALGSDLLALSGAKGFPVPAAFSATRPTMPAGADPAETWTATGWFKGPDGKWKWEIPDAGASLNLSALRQNPKVPEYYGPAFDKQLTLGDVLDHPELYKNYPELANTPVLPGGMFWGLQGIKGGVTADGKILLTQAKPDDLLSTLLHEIQHKVQATEGFARGGNSAEFLPPGFDEAKKLNNDVIKSYKDQIEEELKNRGDTGYWNGYSFKQAMQAREFGQKISPYDQPHLTNAEDILGVDGAQKLYERLKQADEFQRQSQAAFDKYQSLAGEVESRLVEERKAKGDYTTYPPAMPGYPPGTQIVRFRGAEGTPQASFTGWHGTGADFDNFSDNYIGTGEGAQAYGWGHYVAGDKGIGEYYSNKLGKRETEWMLDGKPLSDWAEELEPYLNGTTALPMTHPLYSDVHSMAKALYEIPWNADLTNSVMNLENSGHTDAADWITDNLHRFQPPKTAGNLLHVEIKPDEHELLDWDRPLSEQPEKIQNAIHSLMIEPSWQDSAPLRKFAVESLQDKTGEELYHGFVNHKHDDLVDGLLPAGMSVQQAASKALHEAGVPGIKYLDSNSRRPSFVVHYTGDATPLKPEGNKTSQIFRSEADAREFAEENLGWDLSTPESSKFVRIEQLPQKRNYVIFDPSNLRVKAKNGVPLIPVDHDPFAAGGQQ